MGRAVTVGFLCRFYTVCVGREGPGGSQLQETQEGEEGGELGQSRLGVGKHLDLDIGSLRVPVNSSTESESFFTSSGGQDPTTQGSPDGTEGRTGPGWKTRGLRHEY